MQRFGRGSHINTSPKIDMVIRSITPELPDGSTVFLFGSAMRTSRCNDVDLLILYDPALCPPEQAHREHKAFVDCAARETGLPIHLCLLTYDEERACGFIQRVSARFNRCAG